MNQSLKFPLIVLLCSIVLIALAGCREEGPAERAGKEIDKAAEQMGNSLNKLGDDLKKSVN